MVLFLEVLDGLKQGSRFRLSPGQIIGRAHGDIIIEDQKISSKHAQIELDNKEQFVLNDLDSSNGIISGNRRVKKLALMPGVKFRLGRTNFQILQVDDQPAEEFARIRTWRENLAEHLPMDQIQNQTAALLIQSFSPSVRMTFTQGIQLDEELVLTYGPRKAGAFSLDIDLRDPDAPETAFEIYPEAGVARIRNLCHQRLTLNSQPVEEELLRDGDLIRFGTTTIKVTYV